VKKLFLVSVIAIMNFAPFAYANPTTISGCGSCSTPPNKKYVVRSYWYDNSNPPKVISSSYYASACSPSCDE
jgi:hypothetical protein